MIDAKLRNDVLALHRYGLGVRDISRRVGVSRNSVRAIVKRYEKGESGRERKYKIPLDRELLERLYDECGGYAQRVHEKLVEEHDLEIQYSTLTRRLRELEINTKTSPRAAHVGDEPGAEMQHDTSTYDVVLGGLRVRLIASVLYLRYSKRRYVRFYRRFDRFRMKCFFHEALAYWGYAAAVCIIDNTNLARLSGAGATARIAPEMEEFARRYGFLFQCHEIGHANRKAGEERSFRTIGTNLLSGRSFESLEDLNRQAFEWASVRMERRAQTSARIVPAKAFELEKAHLAAVPPALTAPYRVTPRVIDQYGYVAFGGNWYWVPGESRGDANVLEFADLLEICRGHEVLCSYPLPAEFVRDRRFSPEGMPRPQHGPRRSPRPTAEEESRLRSLAAGVDAYLTWALASCGVRRHHYVRGLFALSQRMGPDLFVRSVERAHRYKVGDLEGLERIARVLVAFGEAPPTQAVEFDACYRQSEAYREGELAGRPDLSIYDDARGEQTDGRDDDDEAEEAAPVGAP
jgi:transposase